MNIIRLPILLAVGLSMQVAVASPAPIDKDIIRMEVTKEFSKDRQQRIVFFTFLNENRALFEKLLEVFNKLGTTRSHDAIPQLIEALKLTQKQRDKLTDFFKTDAGKTVMMVLDRHLSSDECKQLSAAFGL